MCSFGVIVILYSLLGLIYFYNQASALLKLVLVSSFMALDFVYVLFYLLFRLFMINKFVKYLKRHNNLSKVLLAMESAKILSLGLVLVMDIFGLVKLIQTFTFDYKFLGLISILIDISIFALLETLML